MPDGQTYQAPDRRKNLVGDLAKHVTSARTYWKAQAFRQMQRDQDLTYYGASAAWSRSSRYVVNICQAHVKSRTGQLYAKNPKAIAKPRPRKHYRYWDGRQTSLSQAVMMAQTAQAAGLPIPIQAGLILSDFMEGTQRKKLIREVGETLSIVYDYFCKESDPDFKKRMKACVRRAITNGVSYCKIGFQREMTLSPPMQGRVNDLTERLAEIERMIEEVGDGEITETDADAERLRLEIQSLMENPDQILREGLVFDFPPSTSIIPDTKCTQLQGFVGADWVCHEIVMTPDMFHDTYGINLKKEDYTAYTERGVKISGVVRTDTKIDNPHVCVWEIYHKKDGLVYTIWDGGKDFAEEPAAPQVKLDRFWPIYVLTFNDLEHEKKLFPPSDIALIRKQQAEMNESREGLRQHRVAARPKYVTPSGTFEDDEKANIAKQDAHTVIEVKNLTPGARITDIIQAMPTVGVDPNLYRTAHVFEDTTIQVGASEANFGSISGGTATESAIAEDARLVSVSDHVDELDGFLSDVAQGSGQILLQEMSPETIMEIAGPGAVWPEFDSAEVTRELFLDVVAGSSGRPNRAADIANMERVAPFLLQVPGVSQDWLARKLVRVVDDAIDIDEAIADGMPSMVALNQMAQISTGNPATDPNAQGQEGGNTARPSDRGAPGSRETLPAPVINARATGR